MISFTLNIPPQAWQRVQRGRSGIAYVPGKTRAFKYEVAYLAQRFKPKSLLDGPIRLTIKFILKKPQKPKFKDFPATKPDLDNLVKGVKDALNGVIWKDDSRICEYGAGTGKYYALDGSSPRIEICVEEIAKV